MPSSLPRSPKQSSCFPKVFSRDGVWLAGGCNGSCGGFCAYGRETAPVHKTEEEPSRRIKFSDIEAATEAIVEEMYDNEEDRPVYKSTFQGYQPKSTAAQRLRASQIPDDEPKTSEQGPSVDESESLTPQPITVAVGSTNPVKINSAHMGIAQSSQAALGVVCTGYGVSSGVSDQPVGDSETQAGAETRAIAAFEAYKKEHGEGPCYSVGLEGGISSVTEATMECFAYACVYDGQRRPH